MSKNSSDIPWRKKFYYEAAKKLNEMPPNELLKEQYVQPKPKIKTICDDCPKIVDGVYVILIVLLFLIITAYFVVTGKKEEYAENWEKYKCNPIIMPFAGYINPNTSTSKNFSGCMFSIIKSILNILMQPIYMIMTLVLATIKSIQGAIERLKNMVKSIRLYILRYLEDLSKSVSNSQLAMRYIFIKLKSIIDKQNGMLVIVKYVFISIGLTLQWLWNVPRLIVLMIVLFLIALSFLLWFIFPVLAAIVAVLAAGFGIAFCFDENSQVEMKDGSKKKICKIKIGDVVKEGGEVKGVIKTTSEKVEMYNLNGVIVAGDHLVKIDNKWKRVSSVKESKLLDKYRKPYLYNLITENKCFIVNSLKFSDFSETSDNDVNMSINKAIIDNLNEKMGSKTNYKDNYETLMETGYDPDTLIYTKKGHKKIKDLSIGDELLIGEVNGISEILSENIKMYNYKGIIVSGANPVLESGCWKRVYQADNSIEINYTNKKIINICTTNNLVMIEDNMFSDFSETGDNKLLDKIDEITEHVMNMKD